MAIGDDGERFPCQEKKCQKVFSSEKGLNIHLSKMHKYSNTRVEKTCPECEEDFTVSKRNKTQECCSRDCSVDYRFG